MAKTVQPLRNATTRGLRKPISARKQQPARTIESARAMVRGWAGEIANDTARHTAAQTLIAEVIRRYAEAVEQRDGVSLEHTAAPIGSVKLDRATEQLAQIVADAVVASDEIEAAFQIGTLYTLALPEKFRSDNGVFYTPPSLTHRLLDMAEEAGVDWRTARVLDPACGGGAFLAPVARRIVDALADCLPAMVLQNIAGRIRGLELDPFAAWMSQVFLEIMLRHVIRAAGRPLPQLVTVCDTLDETPPSDGYDLVIGNPPFGRLKLSAKQRARYRRSLYGHANLYGVFMDVALRWAKPGGVIAYITPTSFLAGEYFKALRELLAAEAPPRGLDLIADRKGVFEDVLQETVLSTFVRGAKPTAATVRHLHASNDTSIEIAQVGTLRLPTDPFAPWILPRAKGDAELVKKLATKRTRLIDWGYTVSTGPLVWNRHKSQLRSKREKTALPLIWAEAVGANGSFAHRAEKRNHAPYFRPAEGDEWLITRTPCVLLQRTTAKEQHRRLIAAELPASFIKRHGAVVIENHLNMVRPVLDTPKVSPRALATVLNSSVVDRAFRCISGSVAVSAFELEALPLPTVKQMAAIERLIASGADAEEIEGKLETFYLADTAR